MTHPLAGIAWRILGVAALAACVFLGWMLYEFAYNHRVDNVVFEWFRSIYVTVRVMFRMDPILTALFFPLGILVVLILTGLLIWMQRER